MTPRTRAPPISTQPSDSPVSTRQPLVVEKPVPSPVTLERQAETISPTLTTTKSGRQVRRPQRLIESCQGGDVVTLKPVGIPLRGP